MKKFANKNINSLLQKETDSTNWLISCLDPYHDYQYEVDGLPDERVAPSVTQIHNQSYTLTVPTVASGNLWDASILFTGFNSPIDWNNLADDGGMITVASSAQHSYDHSGISTGAAFGALNIWAGASGSTMSTGAPHTIGDTFESLGSVLSQDRCRLIGCAFEINNTTAEIYKQGSVTVAMLPETACDTSMCRYYDTNVSPFEDTFVQMDRAVRQSCTLPPLLSVPGSQTWKAAEGIYAIPRMSMVPRDVLSYSFTPGPSYRGAVTRLPVLYGSDGKTATPSPAGHISPATSPTQAIFKPFGPNGFSPLQVFFSGLSAETTLTITFRTIVEYFPALGSPLLPLASPSPVFDPKILSLYSSIAAKAPYAVPVDQNSAGDYFRKVLSIMGQSLELISPIFGQYAPVVSIIGSASKKLSQAVDKKGAGMQANQRKPRK